MRIVSKKNMVIKEVRRPRKIKLTHESKNIGLKEKNEEANRLVSLLKNPELLK
jgi:hypothetical protein